MIRLTEREQMVWDKRNEGLTFKQIAEDLGLCVQTVSFAYRKAYRKIEYEKERLKPTELEIYKKALEMAFKNINVEYDGYCYYEFKGCDYHWTTDIAELIEICLASAQKELEDENINQRRHCAI